MISPHHETVAFLSALDAHVESLLRTVKPLQLREALQHATRGGKKVRPLVALLACSAAGGSWRRALHAATAIELLHTSSLIHDDLMDDSPLRRGVPTLHTLYNVSTAILAGDTLIALAFQLIHAVDVPQATQIVQTFNRAFRELCEGQAYDLCLSSEHSADAATHRVMVEKKTAALFRAAGEIGALHATGDRATVEALALFGYNLGMAFQAQDDLLDVIGAEEALGKPTMLDRRNGKQTYVTLLPAESDGSACGVAATVDRFTDSALEALAVLPPSPAREVLTMLARSLERRES